MKIKKEVAILLAVLPVTFMNTLDSSIVNVALPTMSKQLGTDMAGIEWVVTSYLITICALILLFGRLGDIVGKNRIFKFGTVVFILGSLMCGIARTLPVLIVARIIQAIGSAATMATNQGIITGAFSSKKRGKALGMLGTAVALGTMTGPTLGGIMVSVMPWEYIFLINVPIGIIVYIIGKNILKDIPKKQEVKMDYKGVILFMTSIVLLFLTINKAKEIGFFNKYIVLALIIAVLLLLIFIKAEKNGKYPMLDISIFKNKLFSMSIFCAFIVYVAMGSINIILPFYFQDVLGLTPGKAGLMLTIAPIILAIVGPISGYVSDKIGSEKISFIGLTIFAIGILLVSIFKERSSLLLVGIIIGTVSIGNAMFQSPNNSLVMSTVDKKKLGIAGSVNGLVRNLGNTTGVALSTGILYSLMSSKIGYTVKGYVDGRADAFIYGMKYVFIVLAVICLSGIILSAKRAIIKNN